jgi:hypothetical protein
MTRFAAAAIAAVACTAVFGAGAQATPEGKVLICHGSASATSPWELIEVSTSALNGHFDGTEPGHGDNNHLDFFPNAGGDCSDGPGGGDF